MHALSHQIVIFYPAGSFSAPSTVVRQDSSRLEGMLDELYEWVEDAEAKLSNVLHLGDDMKSVEGQLSQHEVCTSHRIYFFSCLVQSSDLLLGMFSGHTGGDG